MDALARYRTSLARGGRGAVTGWTPCPLCNKRSAKRFARGRGLAAHLHAVHTPWKAKTKKGLSKKNQKKRSRQQQQQQPDKETQQSSPQDDDDDDSDKVPAGWDPTPAERHAWDLRVLELVQSVECNTINDKEDDNHSSKNKTRTGQVATSYRASLPAFLQAAAAGDLTRLQSMIQQAVTVESKDNDQSTENNTDKRRDTILALLDTKDRHGSMAEHWAAGEGHLDCLQYLVQQRQQQQQQTLANSNLSSGDSQQPQPKKRLRRRDGKTPLHYAARNGRLACAQFLLSQKNDSVNVDTPSGDGTTPLHLACYGGHFGLVRYLVETAGAQVHAANEWQCTAAHWVAMCRRGGADKKDEIWLLCDWLHKQHGVQFHRIQSQGHSPLHKAAQHKNEPVLQWMAQNLSLEQKQRAAAPDQGGHTPWDILQNMGGKASLVEWLKRNFGGAGDPSAPVPSAGHSQIGDEKSSDE